MNMNLIFFPFFLSLSFFISAENKNPPIKPTAPFSKLTPLSKNTSKDKKNVQNTPTPRPQIDKPKPTEPKKDDAALLKNKDQEKNIKKEVPKELKGSGLTVPRFVSIKNVTNLRIGPGKLYKVDWVINQKNTPVEIIEEYDYWRKIRTYDGTQGWIKQNMLSGKRTVLPFESAASKKTPDGSSVIPIYSSKEESDNNIAALIEIEIPLELLKIENDWCQVSHEKIKGWIMKKNLWGIYPSENKK